MSLPGLLPQWLEGNKEYSKTFPGAWRMEDRRPQAKASGKITIVLTCLDPRCVPEQYFGSEFNGPVIRNAGGRPTVDAVRSILALRTLVDLSTVAVVHHTDCGIFHMTDDEIAKDAVERTPEAKQEIKQILSAPMTAKEEDFVKLIKDDVKTLREYKVLGGMDIVGLKLDTFTGVVEKVDV